MVTVLGPTNRVVSIWASTDGGLAGGQDALQGGGAGASARDADADDADRLAGVVGQAVRVGDHRAAGDAAEVAGQTLRTSPPPRSRRVRRADMRRAAAAARLNRNIRSLSLCRPSAAGSGSTPEAGAIGGRFVTIPPGSGPVKLRAAEPPPRSAREPPIPYRLAHP